MLYLLIILIPAIASALIAVAAITVTHDPEMRDNEAIG